MCAKIYGDRWESIGELPAGGQAAVFIVKDRNNKYEGEFVLKRLKNLKRLQRFENEIRALMEIDNEHVLKIIDYDIKDKKPYYVSEYCRGGSLFKVKNPFWHGSAEEKFRLIEEIIDGLAAAHHHDPPIIHRDLKPDNIYLRDEKGPAVIGDFGLCYVENSKRQTLSQEAVGSMNYMHPELEDGIVQEVKPYHDLYSLGKVIYWIFSEGIIFSREKHREEGYDLCRFALSRDESGKATHYLMRIFEEHINRLLDGLITLDVSKRMNSINSVRSRLELTKRLFLESFNPVGNNVLQLCVFCGLGYYYTPKEHEIDFILNNLFGFATNRNKDKNRFVYKVCNKCGHIQLFSIARRDPFVNWGNPETEFNDIFKVIESRR